MEIRITEVEKKLERIDERTNIVNNTLKELSATIGKILEQTSNFALHSHQVRENKEDIEKLDMRLRSLERKIWIAIGAAASVGGGLVGAIL
jgi:tetrahydromethanopterin S-methyltransferase subunit G